MYWECRIDPRIVSVTVQSNEYRWLVLGYTLVIQAVSVGILVYCFALFVVPWLEEFSASRRDVLLAISLLQLSTGIWSPLVGRAMDRMPMRFLVLSGVAMLIAGLLLASAATALWQILAIYATCFALAMALMGTLAAQTLVTKWFDDKRGFAIGISATGTNLGGIVFPWVAAGLLLDIGWRDTFVWLAATALVLAGPASWWVLRREPERSVPGVDNPRSSQGWTTRGILGTRVFWIPLISIVPLNIAFSAVQFNIGAFAGDLGFGGAAASLIMTCSVMMVVGKFFFGALGDRFDHRVLYWISAAFMISGLLQLRGQPDYSVTLAAIVCIGLSGGAILPMFALIFGSRFGVASFGRVMGLAMLGVTTGAVGPIIAGWMYDVTGSYDLAFLCSALLCVPGAALMAFLPKPDALASVTPQ